MSFVLIDSSAWIEFFKNGTSRASLVVDELLEEELGALTPIVLTEVISGARTKSEYDELRLFLGELKIYSAPEDILWENIAKSRFELARHGVPASIMDLHIAWTAVHHDIPLLTLDKYFQHIQKVVPLKLVKI